MIWFFTIALTIALVDRFWKIGCFQYTIVMFFTVVISPTLPQNLRHQMLPSRARTGHGYRPSPSSYSNRSSQAGLLKTMYERIQDLILYGNSTALAPVAGVWLVAAGVSQLPLDNKVEGTWGANWARAAGLELGWVGTGVLKCGWNRSGGRLRCRH